MKKKPLKKVVKKVVAKKAAAKKPKVVAKKKTAVKKPAPPPRPRRTEGETPDWYSCAFCHTYEEKPFAVCKACGHPQPAGK